MVVGCRNNNDNILTRVVIPREGIWLGIEPGARRLRVGPFLRLRSHSIPSSFFVHSPSVHSRSLDLLGLIFSLPSFGQVFFGFTLVYSFPSFPSTVSLSLPNVLFNLVRSVRIFFTHFGLFFHFVRALKT